MICACLQEGVGDTPDSYAYDGNRVRKWNVTTTNYGKVKNSALHIQFTGHAQFVLVNLVDLNSWS